MKKIKEICTNISFYEFENYTNAWYNEKNFKNLLNSYIPFIIRVIL